jgi:hypothetical protein
MAVDTRQKRASAIGLGLAALLILPAPGGTIDQADQQQAASAYAGILAAPSVEIPGDIVTTAPAIFARSVTLSAAHIDRTVTGELSTVARTITIANAER